MDDNVMHKLINKVKDKFIKPKQTYSQNFEYAFSTEEIESINKQNKQKIQEIKQDIYTKKQDNKKSNIDTDEVLSKIETNIERDDSVTEPISSNNEEPQPINPIKELTVESLQEESITKEPIIDESIKLQQKNSFIHLNPEHQKYVMDKWNDIKPNKIDKDIMDGKDLLNHNYTITYADEAARFIHYIRKEYEVVICYLIGFNNEKQGIYDKTIFSNKIDDEWRYLNSYIKILEKIRKNK